MSAIREWMSKYRRELFQKMGMGHEGPAAETLMWNDGARLRVERRRELRQSGVGACTYALVRSVDRDGVTLEEGRGTALNESPSGLQLLLGIAPREGQLLEVQAQSSVFKGAHYLAHVCWTKLLREDEQGALYLVGCRVSLGASHFHA